MSLSSLIVIILLIILISYYVISYDKIVKELQEIRTKCIKIHNLSTNKEKETFVNNENLYTSYSDRDWEETS